ncbi:MAG: STAS domain-containing protein [bacterium]
MPNYSTISVQTEDGATIIAVLSRRVYLQIVDTFREELQQVLQSTAGAVLLNLEKVSVMNSVGLGVLIAAHDQLGKQDRPFVITNLQPLMQDIFSRMKLETVIAVRKTQPEGLEYLRSRAK